jgi:hypothetical protein
MGGGMAGRGGTTGQAGTFGRGGTTGSGGRGGTGTTGANCVDDIVNMNYAFPPAAPCSACMENNMSRQALCQAMIDCLNTTTPCSSSSSNCWLTCRNMNGISGPTEACVLALVNASCM